MVIMAVAVPGELVLVVQKFPRLQSELVGKVVIPNPDALLKLFSTQFDPVRTLWYEDRVNFSNDNWLIALLSAR